MTKAQQILGLYARGRTTRVIAGIVYGLDDDAPAKEWDKRMSYCRVVARQRKGSGASESDRRWREKNKEHVTAYMREWRAKNRDYYNAYKREWYARKRTEARP